MKGSPFRCITLILFSDSHFHLLFSTYSLTDGNFVCKVFDTFTPFTVGLIYILYRVFDQVCMIKPYTSRPANSERFLSLSLALLALSFFHSLVFILTPSLQHCHSHAISLSQALCLSDAVSYNPDTLSLALTHLFRYIVALGLKEKRPVAMIDYLFEVNDKLNEIQQQQLQVTHDHTTYTHHIRTHTKR